VSLSTNKQKEKGISGEFSTARERKADFLAEETDEHTVVDTPITIGTLLCHNCMQWSRFGLMLDVA
jgi:hypothetical protein